MKTTGNTVLITGGATGIGLALAEVLLREGNEVIICGRRADRLSAANASLKGIHTIKADVSRETERRRLIFWMIDNFPSFNVIVNNAGIQQIINLGDDNRPDIIDKEININLSAPIHLTDLVIPHFRQREEAAIINISSGLGYIPIAIMPVYCATKAAIHSFCITSRFQLKETNIKVFEIIPPIVETELGRDTSRKERVVNGIPAAEVAEETLKALREDKLEFPVSMASNLYNAAHSDKSDIVFLNINSNRHD